jgi:hypothetical protein
MRGDKMKFPNEVWISERLRGGYYVVDFIIEADEDDRVRYIRADLVPISCGGTMGEKVCRWKPTYRTRDWTTYETECGKYQSIPVEDDIHKFCPDCGGKLAALAKEG